MRQNIPFLLLLLILCAWIASVQCDPFFWDSVQLGSKHAHFFYENKLRWALLPASMDSGHPPVFGYYLAVVWAVFGKSLPASHWAMFPFLAGLAWATLKLGKQTGPANLAFWLVPIVFMDAVVAGQSALVGPDLVLACFFMLSIQGFLREKKYWILLGLTGLCIISMRGMMTAGALFAWQLILLRQSGGANARQVVERILLFFPGFTLAIGFLTWHYKAAGWVGHHPDSPWAPAFEQVGSAGVVRNILVVGWRWLDFGRVFEWLLLGFLVVKAPFRHVAARSPYLTSMLILFGCLLVFLTPSALVYNNLSAHRYFLPGFLCLHLIIFQWLAAADLNCWKKTLLFCALTFGLATGNCWIYPRGISMGWDATLAHLPYHKLRAQMLAYIDTHQIPIESIGSAFPNNNSGEALLLNGDNRCFAEKDWLHNDYMLVSNIFNDFSANDIQRLERDWTLTKRLEQSGVWLALYKKTA